MRASSLLAVRPERDPEALAHLVFRSRPNYTLCGVRLVGKWTAADWSRSGDRICTTCWARHTRLAKEEEARWAAWQAGEARDLGPGEDESAGEGTD